MAIKLVKVLKETDISKQKDGLVDYTKKPKTNPNVIDFLRSRGMGKGGFLRRRQSLQMQPLMPDAYKNNIDGKKAPIFGSATPQVRTLQLQSQDENDEEIRFYLKRPRASPRRMKAEEPKTFSTRSSFRITADGPASSLENPLGCSPRRRNVQRAWSSDRDLLGCSPRRRKLQRAFSWDEDPKGCSPRREDLLRASIFDDGSPSPMSPRRRKQNEYLKSRSDHSLVSIPGTKDRFTTTTESKNLNQVPSYDSERSGISHKSPCSVITDMLVLPSKPAEISLETKDKLSFATDENGTLSDLSLVCPLVESSSTKLSKNQHRKQQQIPYSDMCINETGIGKPNCEMCESELGESWNSEVSLLSLSSSCLGDDRFSSLSPKPIGKLLRTDIDGHLIKQMHQAVHQASREEELLRAYHRSNSRIGGNHYFCNSDDSGYLVMKKMHEDLRQDALQESMHIKTRVARRTLCRSKSARESKRADADVTDTVRPVGLPSRSDDGGLLMPPPQTKLEDSPQNCTPFRGGWVDKAPPGTGTETKKSLPKENQSGSLQEMSTAKAKSHDQPPFSRNRGRLVSSIVQKLGLH